jgi:hypothetical protein
MPGRAIRSQKLPRAPARTPIAGRDRSADALSAADRATPRRAPLRLSMRIPTGLVTLESEILLACVTHRSSRTREHAKVNRVAGARPVAIHLLFGSEESRVKEWPEREESTRRDDQSGNGSGAGGPGQAPAMWIAAPIEEATDRWFTRMTCGQWSRGRGTGLPGFARIASQARRSMKPKMRISVRSRIRQQ